MPSPKSVPALLTLALVALAAVAHATTYSESCYA